MKKYFKLFYIGFLLINFCSRSQNIIVNSDNFSGQELVEDILFGTNCVENIIVTNLVTGNFSNNELSYGYFNANNSNFPFSEGLVLTTGRLSNVPGPNDDLSDDDAPNWGGDQDLEDALGINNTLNATIIEFSFVPQANSINFRYLFASEEYRENEPTTCQFSDAFAFLIRPVGGQYENLALVPGTTTPVQVTTVRPEIPGACDALNEEYFGQFNGTVSPINFNGQTTILTAETNVQAGQTYEIKLVIADETNFRFDSAVFIEANSFNVGVELGQTQTLCDNETTTLQIENSEATAIRWFFENQIIDNTSNELIISQDNFGSGLYSVEVDLAGGCTAVDEVNIFFDEVDIPNNLSITACVDNDGVGVFNLFYLQDSIGDDLQILNFYNTLNEAQTGVNPITNPENFTNTSTNQTVFVRVLSPGNCALAAPVDLVGQSVNLLQLQYFTTCFDTTDDVVSFSIDEILDEISAFLDLSANDINLYNSEPDAINQSNPLDLGILDINIEDIPVQIFARSATEANCEILPVQLQLKQIPELTDANTAFTICTNENASVILEASVISASGQLSYLWSTGDVTESIMVSEAGNYTVTVSSSQNVESQQVSCSNTRTFTVVASEIADVSFSQTGFVGQNNQLIINATGIGDYEYALNNSGYVDSNIFDIDEVENTFSVRDKNGCGIIEVDFIALRIPDFFTPNGDGFNDYWQIEGVRQSDSTINTIYIFDRYGKLIYENIPQQIGWDGTYKGKPMPQQDYWYNIILNSGRSVIGHFTLKR